MLITRGKTYDEIYNAFRWQLPERYNIAHDVCDRHAGDPGKIALIHEAASGSVDRYSFRQIQGFANRLANTLVHFGLQRGDRVLIYLGQHPATAVTHVACWKAGMVSVPTSTLFGVDALEYRLQTSGARVLLTDTASYPAVAAARAKAPALQTVLMVDGSAPDTLPFWDTIAKASDQFETLQLHPDD